MTNLFRPIKENAPSPFSRFVVVEVLSRSYHPREKIGEWAEKIKNAKFFSQTKGEEGSNLEHFLIAPRNSLIAKKITGGESKDPEIFIVMYPFFSSHISLPVKPGEQVWGMEETDGKAFWLSRIHEPDAVEDLNFTHGDRRGIPTTQETNELEDATPDRLEVSRVPHFPNGENLANREVDSLDPASTDVLKLRESGADLDYFSLPEIDSYKKIAEENVEVGSIVYEPIPRFTKRPGDLALHGSNNTSIVLGTERGYGLSTRPDGESSNANPENDLASANGLSEGMGSIDIVAGRGRIHDGAEANVDSDPKETRPRVVLNSREGLETDKNVGLDTNTAPDGSAFADPAEGDPDFVHDSSRIYVSMKTNPDELFSLEYPDQPEEGSVVEPTPDNAAIVFKSDQIRIIARKDEENEINGSIRIIKEGTGDEDRATIVLQPDGSIMIDGPKIVIGSGIESGNGEGEQVFLGRGATESIILGDKLIEMLKALEDKFNKHIHNTGAGPSSPHAAGGATIDSAEDWDTSKSKIGKTK